jgi:hypothetical protein
MDNDTGLFDEAVVIWRLGLEVSQRHSFRHVCHEASAYRSDGSTTDYCGNKLAAIDFQHWNAPLRSSGSVRGLDHTLATSGHKFVGGDLPVSVGIDHAKIDDVRNCLIL